MGIVNIDLNYINLDNNFDEDDPETIVLIRLLAQHIKFEKRKKLEKMIADEQMSDIPAWRLNRWWDCRMPEGEKKQIDPMLTEELRKCISSIQLVVLAHPET